MKTTEQKAAWARYIRAWSRTATGKASIEKYHASVAYMAKNRRFDRSEKGRAKRHTEKARILALARQKKYQKTPKGRLHNATMLVNRRATERNAAGSHTPSAWNAIRASYLGLCVYCLGVATTRDHVIPLRGGGTNDAENIVPACHSCNSSKKNSPLLVWLAGRAA